jgi:aspartyl-tRNA(Asn)/glutamyl-tRNA(Gln) amidotransferase subunit B
MTAATAVKYQPVIGVEVHVQLNTRSKMFCGCAVQFGAEPNSLTCPVCQAQPGALPTVNRQAVEHAVRIGLALNCQIASRTKFDRKNYFYPDLPKGYQISQYDQPICFDGWLELLPEQPGDQPVRVSISRAHMEEDTGKSVHMENFSLIDLNRAGTPLVEIVTGPDMHSAAEAHAYLTALKRNLSYLAVSPLNMEKGSLRCDLNVSLRPEGTEGLPPYKVEVKNLNSFSNARDSINYEIERQAKVLATGKFPASETRLWDVTLGETRPMRSKEATNDYRYFPEPDLPVIGIDAEWVEQLRAALPELPDTRMLRLVGEFGLRMGDASQIVDDHELADFFEQTVALCGEPQKVANWVIGEVAPLAADQGKSIIELGVKPSQVAGMIQLLAAGKLNNITAKEVFPALIAQGGEPEAVASAMGKLISNDDGELDRVIGEVIAEFEKAVADYRSGKTQTLGFLVGQAMRKLRGRADPKTLGARFEQLLAAE